jgi:hypothetical protein
MEGVVRFRSVTQVVHGGNADGYRAEQRILGQDSFRAEVASLDLAACPGGPDCFTIEMSAQCVPRPERPNGFKR